LLGNKKKQKAMLFKVFLNIFAHCSAVVVVAVMVVVVVAFLAISHTAASELDVTVHHAGTWQKRLQPQ
jgi:hypothetical protein